VVKPLFDDKHAWLAHHPISQRVMRALALMLMLCIVAACSSGPTPLTFLAPQDIKIQRLEWRGKKTGVVWLRRHYQVIIDVSSDPSSARSRIEFHGLLARFDPSGEGETLRVLTPKNARLTSHKSRIVYATGWRDTSLKVKTKAPGGMDPSQVSWSLTYPRIKVGEVLEIMVRFDVDGTLVTDARPLGQANGPTAELLLSYSVPSSATGAMAVSGHNARPITAKKNGRTVFGLMLNDVPSQQTKSPYVRYTTREASPRGHEQVFANTWKDVVSPYRHEFVERGPKLRGNAAVPFKVKEATADSLRAVYRWARNRIQHTHAFKASWRDGGPLPERLTRNTLNATDKIHLLHWLLEASGFRHEIAMARSNKWPSTDVRLPAPGLFDVPLIYVGSFKIWLDPACADCVAGQVRPNLRGQQALIVSGTTGVGTLHTLPNGK
jgi:hypothetical protein